MTASAPMGIIAAAGEIPRHIAEGVVATGQPVFIVALKDIATADFAGFPSTTLRVGGFKDILAAFQDAGCVEIMLAGKFARPKLSEIMPDSMASKVAFKLLTGGDNAALGMVREIVGKAGMTIIESDRFLGALKAEAGLIAGPDPDDDIMSRIDRGRQVLASLGSHDVGQTVVVQGERVIAIEAAEGTDAMINRSASLIDPDLGAAVMIKMLKSGQDRGLDPPVIGAETISAAITAGIAVIAIEAGGVIIADRIETIRQADAADLTIIGISP